MQSFEFVLTFGITMIGLKPLLCGLVLMVAASGWAQTPKPGQVLLDHLRAGGLVLFMRHAHADVGEDALGDSTYWKDCKKQRNLSAAGKQDAHRVGLAVRGLGIPVTRVFVSPLCRAIDTGQLLQLGVPEQRQELSDFNTWRAMGLDPGLLLGAVNKLISQAPPKGSNHLLISHAHRGRFTAHPSLDLIEMGTIAVFKPDGAGSYQLLATLRPGDWQYLGAQELPLR